MPMFTMKFQNQKTGMKYVGKCKALNPAEAYQVIQSAMKGIGMTLVEWVGPIGFRR